MSKNINLEFGYFLISPCYTLARTFFLSVSFFVISISLNAQIISSFSDQFDNKPSFFIKLDARGSFISNRHVRINGIKGGLSYENIKIGLGYNWLKTNYRPIYNGENVDLKSKNVSVFAEYLFLKTKKLNYNANIQLGFGNIYYLLNQNKLANSSAMFYEQSITVEYRVLNYFGIGLGVGYRFVIFNKRLVDENLSAPVYIARFKLYFGDIYKALIKK